MSGFTARHVRIGALLVGAVGVLLSDPGRVSAQAAPTSAIRSDDIRTRLEGTFELEEWQADGRLLRPPQVEGRFSIHDGVILFMTMRSDAPVRESVFGYGTYRIDSAGWTYGYTHLETIRGDETAALTRSVRPPSSSLLKLHWEGDTLIVIGQGSDRREYARDSFVSRLSAAGDYRKWRRVR